ncbi:MAG: YkgJ family cysteine cluster protein [Planctomycetota bacterium]
MWYEQGLHFDCQGCTQCCGGEPGYVWVTGEETGLLAAYMGTSLQDFARKHVRLVGNRKSLRERGNGDCVLLVNGACSVYEARPTQCRTWPFWAANLASRTTWQDLKGRCPGIERGRLYGMEEVDALSTRTRLDRSWLLAFAELLRLYHEADRWASERALSCRACGECCDFERQGHDLYASMIEAGWMAYAKRPGKIGARRCPYFADGKCTNRAGRSLGCRTYFCRGARVPEAMEYHEGLLTKLKDAADALAVPWEYDRIDRILKKTLRRREFRAAVLGTFSA